MKSRSRVLLSIFAATCALWVATPVIAEDQPVAAFASQAKFSAIPTAPKCFTIAVDKGDPTKGASVILARFAPGCVAPFHWHTPSESVMILSGALELQMKDDKPVVAHRGDFFYMPSRHAHRATCKQAAPCLVFLTADAAFDIHWIDEAGNEITLDAAMQKKGKTGKAAKK